MIAKRTTEIAAALPILKYEKPVSYINIESTRVEFPGPPPVMMYGIKNIRADISADTTTTKNIVGESNGIVMAQKRFHAFAPSSRAAS